MKETKDRIEEREQILKIPVDMLLDILAIIVKERLAHEVIQVIPNRSLVVVAISADSGDTKFQKIVYNIQNLISDYQHYRSWENEEVNWRES